MSDDIDIGQISEALNDKMDRDVGNPENLGKIRIAEFAMPGDIYENLTFGADGDIYEAPAIGYFYLEKYVNSGQYVGLWKRDENNNNFYGSYNDTSINNSIQRVMLPVTKGSKVILGYSGSGSVIDFKFIYAVGSESEAN